MLGKPGNERRVHSGVANEDFHAANHAAGDQSTLREHPGEQSAGALGRSAPASGLNKCTEMHAISLVIAPPTNHYTGTCRPDFRLALPGRVWQPCSARVSEFCREVDKQPRWRLERARGRGQRRWNLRWVYEAARHDSRGIQGAATGSRLLDGMTRWLASETGAGRTTIHWSGQVIDLRYPDLRQNGLPRATLTEEQNVQLFEDVFDFLDRFLSERPHVFRSESIT